MESALSARTREVGIYLPAGLRRGSTLPLLIVHDGDDFVDHAGLATVLDNLIHRGDMPPFIAALTRPGERNGEYTGDPRHADFLDRGAAARPAGAPSRCARTGRLRADGLEPRRRRLACDRLPPSRRSAAWSCSRAPSSSTDACCANARPAVRAGRRSRRSSARSDPARPSEARFRRLRHIRRADRAEPGARALPPATRPRGALPGDARRPPLAELARPAAGRPELDLA